MKDLKEKTLRGGLARLVGQGASFSLRLVSLMVLARILRPRDFGLVGMVTVFTGVLDLFRDFGLSAAAVQHRTVTEEQISALFWVNILVGTLLGFFSSAMAPALAAFYHEPRLVAITAVLGSGFIFNAAGVQHSAILQRQMRYTALATINTTSLLVSITVGIIGALAGYGYWALVAMTITSPIIGTMGCWIATAWIPKRPQKQIGIRSMIRFGGALTLNGILAYAAFNLDKVLLGRFWGADLLGIYGRAYGLVNIPVGTLNSAAGEVAFSALSRLQDDPARLRTYFLKGYSLVLALTIPITTVCMLFPSDVTLVVLGSRWIAAADIVRLLAPTILIFAMINPIGWLMTSIGLVGRNLKLACVFAPLIAAGYVVGLPYGPKGVALGFSSVMVLCAVPLTAFCVRGTPVSLRDMMLITARPLVSAIVAGVTAVGVRMAYGHFLAAFPRLVAESATLLVAFSVMLLFVAGQKSFYLDLLRSLVKRSSLEDKSVVTA